MCDRGKRDDFTDALLLIKAGSQLKGTPPQCPVQIC